MSLRTFALDEADVRLLTNRWIDRSQKPEQSLTREIRAIVNTKPITGITRFIKTSPHCRDHILFTVEKDSGKGIDIFPASQNFFVHHQRNVQTKSFTQNFWGRIQNIRNKQKSRLNQMGQQIAPG